MEVTKATAALPRKAVSLRRTSLTRNVVVLICCLGILAWLLLDILQERTTAEAASREWHGQFEQDAARQRARIKHSVATFFETAQYLAGHSALRQRVQDWQSGSDAVTPRVSLWQPNWLARIESLDGSIAINFAAVYGRNRERLAIYHKQQRPLPAVLEIAADVGMLQVATQQPQIVSIRNVPFLIAAFPVQDGMNEVTGTLLIASSVDNGFLQRIIGPDPRRTASGLLLGDGQKPVAVSSSRLAEAFAEKKVGREGRFSLVANELLLESEHAPGLRHALWIDEEFVSRSNAPYVFSVRQQRLFIILLFSLLCLTVVARIAVRIEKIHRKVDGYARRLGITLLPDSSHGDQIDHLKRHLERMSEEVIAETYALEYQAQHDNLTNLPNRSLLFERMEVALQNAQDDNEPLALCIMDLDQFKEINDTLGHHIGDRLLQEVARRLASVLRRTDTVSRLGGDEFAALLPGADHQRAKAICRKIIAAMERPIKVENLRLRIGISIGIALCPEHGGDGNLLLQHADVAMYEAKRKALGFCFYMAERDEHSISRLGLAGELSDAINQNQLMLEYQPMVDIKTGKIFCVEALVRWSHPEYGCIPPEEFISAAEQTGVIRPLTLWVMDRALEQSRSWQRAGIDLKISVNLSVRSLQDRKLPDQVQKLIDRYNIDPGRVILEITESAIMSDPLSARRVMRRLSNMGFILSIDDFGTGYSSLAYLKQLPVDEIKIDKSFVTQMDSEENDAVIVRATIDLAHNLGLKVVAEGVESTDVWDLLEMLGCDTAQGFFIRKPVGPHELTDWIRSREWEQERWVKPMGAAI
ncbi:MAG: EAL domain-containing protein [Thiogranum sp.]|nr:EAL domain-containing protein [Thiogranum sp.]